MECDGIFVERNYFLSIISKKVVGIPPKCKWSDDVLLEVWYDFYLVFFNLIPKKF